MDHQQEHIKCIEIFLKKCYKDDKLELYDELIIKQLYEIINGNIYDDYDDGILANYAGIYYEMKIKDLINAEKYYLIAHKCGNVHAINNLGYLYLNLEQYDKVEKYSLIGVEHNNNISMDYLAKACYKQDRFEEAEKYYLITIEEDIDSDAMNELAYLYKTQEKIDDAKNII